MVLQDQREFRCKGRKFLDKAMREGYIVDWYWETWPHQENRITCGRCGTTLLIQTTPSHTPTNNGGDIIHLVATQPTQSLVAPQFDHNFIMGPQTMFWIISPGCSGKKHNLHYYAISLQKQLVLYKCNNCLITWWTSKNIWKAHLKTHKHR